jgi:hypothetical protein
VEVLPDADAKMARLREILLLRGDGGGVVVFVGTKASCGTVAEALGGGQQGGGAQVAVLRGGQRRDEQQAAIALWSSSSSSSSSTASGGGGGDRGCRWLVATESMAKRLSFAAGPGEEQEATVVGEAAAAAAAARLVINFDLPEDFFVRSATLQV